MPRSTVLMMCCAVASAATVAGAQLPTRPLPKPERMERTEMDRVHMERSLLDAARSLSSTRVDLVDLQEQLSLHAHASTLPTLALHDLELATKLSGIDMPRPRLAELDLASAALGRIDAEAMAHSLSKLDHAHLRDGAVVPGARPWSTDDPLLRRQPPEPWAQRDPADSLYRVAREALNRGEYRRASDLFQSLGDRYPKSAYAADALYWRAFSLYRVGAVDDLQLALRTLDAQRERYPNAPAKAVADAAALASRIRGALAARGDVRMVGQLQRDAQRSDTTCDREDTAVRVEALSALGTLDPAAATPILRRVLSRRDACSADLRRRALFLLGKRADSTSAETLVSTFVDVARSDPDGNVREDATLWIARVPGERSLSALEELLRTSNDERTQRAAVRALGSSEHVRARSGLRALIERADASERLRAEALGAFDREHSTADDAAFLRSFYARTENPRLKERTVQAIGRLGGAENDRWLLALAQNRNEPVALRAAVLRRTAMGTVPIADLARLYDSLGERELRELVLAWYARRKEPEATDRLLDIARTGTDPQLRRAAISALAGKNDPRTTRLLMEIVDK